MSYLWGINNIPMSEDILVVKDSNGNVLKDGDTVVLIKDLKVKGTTMTIKKGTTVKKIRLTEDADEVDCRVNGTAIVLRTEFLKKG
ncbi:MAG: zinc ribbon domain-containing protein YjdM [Bacteroidota bacterium]